MQASRFLFDTDFRAPKAAAQQAAAQAAASDADATGYARGLAEGRMQAEGQAQARLADAVNRLALAAAALIGETDARHAAIEREAMTLAVTLARTIAGEALDAVPLTAIGEAVAEALRHARGVPHLAVRVNEAFVEDTEALLKRQARERGYEGRLVVLGEPDMALGDVRIEWADGGVVRDRARLAEEAERILAEAVAADAPDH
jgi:flagellar assembly protein FliH